MKTPATILIVDDEIRDRRLLQALLGPEGYVTRTAASGEEALAASPRTRRTGPGGRHKARRAGGQSPTQIAKALGTCRASDYRHLAAATQGQP